MKSHLRKGDYASLNLYFLSDFYSRTGLLGLADCFLYPDYTADRAKNEHSNIFKKDGAKIDINTMPGGNPIGGVPENIGHSLGKCAVHEIGHWMGLYHVFQNQTRHVCNEDDKGDGVDDTPQQKAPSMNCSPKQPHNNFCSIKPEPHRTYLLYGTISTGVSNC